MTQTTNSIVRPEVLLNTYPRFDSAGNKLQIIRVRYCCGHEKEWASLDLGKGWKPLTKAQIMREELQGYVGYRVCQDCAEPKKDECGQCVYDREHNGLTIHYHPSSTVEEWAS